jgi:hypothetical protein
LHAAPLGSLIIGVNLAARATTNDDLKLFTALKDVEKLELYGAEITDAGMTSLSQFPQLKDLTLENTDITNDGIKELAKLSQVRALNLRRTTKMFDEAGIK